MNKKGFTLVELLASLVILSIIMLVAVPSTINVLDRSKKQQYLADAKKLITLAEGYFRGHEDINYPGPNEIVVLYLSVLNDGTFDEDPDGNDYSEDHSFVTITYKQVDESNYTYEYNVQLLGGTSDKNRGVVLSNLEELNSDEKNNRVQKDVLTFTSDIKLCESISTKVFENTSGSCREYD